MSNIFITSSLLKDEDVNKGTISFAISVKVVLVLNFSISTLGQKSGINKPPSLAKPCIKTSSKVLPKSFPLVL